MGHPGEKDAQHPDLIDERGESYEDALRSERAAYLERGLDDRAAEVSVELDRIGAASKSAPVEPETADDTGGAVEAATPPKARRARKG